MFGRCALSSNLFPRAAGCPKPVRQPRQLASALPARFAGAESLVLNGVYHSPLGASDGRPWYGSPGVLEQWESFVIPSASGLVQSAAP